MDTTEPNTVYNGILDDETLAPLKRNHACLQCKKRKVKCDALRPTCSPCLRSHAHALRSAQRNKSQPPRLICSYAEGEDDSPPPMAPEVELPRKRTSTSLNGSAKRLAVSVDASSSIRDKERRAEEERDTLRARVAELEARLAAIDMADLGASTMGTGAPPSVVFQGAPMPSGIGPVQTGLPTPPTSVSYTRVGPELGPDGQVPLPILHIETGEPGRYQTFDFSNLLVLPANWPRNLPSPGVLEHLIETFFQVEPQLPRMIHRANLLARLKLPPSSPDFPFPGLLHAICAAAAPHTPWTTTLPMEQLESVRAKHISLGLDLETCEDFALAQAESAERCIRHSTLMCIMGSGQFVFDILRAHLILSTVYFNKSMPLRSWITAGTPGRLIKALELINRNPRKTDKAPLMPEWTCDREREERLGTVWLSYLTEATLATNSAWSPSLEIEDIGVPLPTSEEEYQQRFDQSGFMKVNPQTAHDADILTSHPVPDPFVLTIKSSLLLGRTSRWIRKWQQRIIKPGDEREGLHSIEFVELNNEILAFQQSLPAQYKNVYRLADSGNLAKFNADLLSLHLLPNLAIILLHEQFVDWDGPDATGHAQIQKAFEAVTGFIHLIPTQLDTTQLITPLLAFSLFNVARFIVKFIARAYAREQFSQAMRWRTDINAISNLLARYGVKQPAGQMLGMYLNNLQRLAEEGANLDMFESCNPEALSRPDLMKEMKEQQRPTASPSTGSSTGSEQWCPSVGSVSHSTTGPSTTGSSPGIQRLSSTGHTPESVCGQPSGGNRLDIPVVVDASLPQVGAFDMSQTPALFDSGLLELLGDANGLDAKANHDFLSGLTGNQAQAWQLG